MRKKLYTLSILCSAVLSFALTGCGTSQQDGVTGVASSGAPIIGAISLQDSSEPAQIRGTTTTGDGSFAFEVNGLRPPFVLKVEWTDSTGHHRMYSFTEEPGTANINPFSNVVFIGAAGISDEILAAGDLEPALIRNVAARHRVVTESLRTVLAPLFDLYQTGQDPVTDEFEADHTGLDAMFDDVRIYVSSGMIIVSNNRTSELIYKGPIDNIASGTFNPQCMPNSQTTGATADGAALYANKCGSCHGQLAASRKKGATADRIQSAISRNAGGMGYLSTLTAAEVQAIADALATAPTPPSTPTTTSTSAPADGAVLYADNCGSCHGLLAASRKKGRTASQIQSAISANAGGMGYLSALTAAEVQAIANALVTSSTPPSTQTTTPTAPTDGAVLYADNCGSCHGQLAASRKKGRSAGQVQAAISANAGGMGYLSSLTTVEVQAIANALVTSSTPPSTSTSTSAPPDGAVLYASWCGSCHGVLATSSMRGRTATQIQSAITSNRGGMGSVVNLTAEQIQAIATALDTLPAQTQTPTTTQIDGAALYTQYCSGCHRNGQQGASATSIQNAINSDRGGMGSLSGLTSEQIQAIATGGTVPATTQTSTSGTIDGAALYTQYCSGCHSALATSGHRGATVSQIQTGINTISGMMSLSTLTAAQIQAIADALNSTTATPTSTPAPACGSCHTIPPGTGHHSTHRSRSCSTCHGTGYSSTNVNSATHANGVINIASGSTPGWNPSTRSCSNSCHGTERW